MTILTDYRCLLVMTALCASPLLGTPKPIYLVRPSCCSIGKAFKKGFKDIRNTLKKAERDVRKETGKTVHNLVKESGKGVQNVANETVKVGPHVIDFGTAVINYTGNTVTSYQNVIKDAGKRVAEGKLADALFHVALDPLRNEEKNLFKLTQESSLAKSMGAIAASAYGGPSGAAAYAAWQTYRSSNGNVELALRAGVLAGFTYMANTELGQMKMSEEFALVKKTILAGSIGGLAVAASGGDDRDVLDGFILAGGMVIIQDGYKNSTGQPLDARSATGDSYCATPNTAGCDVFKNAVYKDKDGNLQVDFSKLDRRASYVGKGYMPDFNEEQLKAWMKDNWQQDKSVLMKTLAKIPGVNAMALYHDDWVLAWKMKSDAAVMGTIIPALVMTYYGTGQMLSDKITDLNIKPLQAGGEKTAPLIRQDLAQQPEILLADVLPDQRVPKEFDLDPANTKRTGDYHVAKADLVPRGRYVVIRNVMTGTLQRVLVIDGLPSNLKGKDQILLSAPTEKALGLTKEHRIVQAEPEDLILISTVDPAPEDKRDVESAYYNKKDTLSFSDFDATETVDWNLVIMGPGGGKKVEKFNNKWPIDLAPGDYMYVMHFEDPKQLPWGYNGYFKVMGRPDPGIWDTVGSDTPASGAPYLKINGHLMEAEFEQYGNAASITSEDGNFLISFLNLPKTNAYLTDEYFVKQCQTCFGAMMVDTQTGKTFIGVKGTVLRSKNSLLIEFDVVELLKMFDKNVQKYQVTARYPIGN
jgi:hypothetical protein